MSCFDQLVFVALALIWCKGLLDILLIRGEFLSIFSWQRILSESVGLATLSAISYSIHYSRGVQLDSTIVQDASRIVFYVIQGVIAACAVLIVLVLSDTFRRRRTLWVAGCRSIAKVQAAICESLSRLGVSYECNVVDRKYIIEVFGAKLVVRQRFFSVWVTDSGLVLYKNHELVAEICRALHGANSKKAIVSYCEQVIIATLAIVPVAYASFLLISCALVSNEPGALKVIGSANTKDKMHGESVKAEITFSAHCVGLELPEKEDGLSKFEIHISFQDSAHLGDVRLCSAKDFDGVDVSGTKAIFVRESTPYFWKVQRRGGRINGGVVTSGTCARGTSFIKKLSGTLELIVATEKRSVQWLFSNIEQWQEKQEHDFSFKPMLVSKSSGQYKIRMTIVAPVADPPKPRMWTHKLIDVFVIGEGYELECAMDNGSTWEDRVYTIGSLKSEPKTLEVRFVAAIEQRETSFTIRDIELKKTTP